MLEDNLGTNSSSKAVLRWMAVGDFYQQSLEWRTILPSGETPKLEQDWADIMLYCSPTFTEPASTLPESVSTVPGQSCELVALSSAMDNTYWWREGDKAAWHHIL